MHGLDLRDLHDCLPCIEQPKAKFQVLQGAILHCAVESVKPVEHLLPNRTASSEERGHRARRLPMDEVMHQVLVHRNEVCRWCVERIRADDPGHRGVLAEELYRLLYGIASDHDICIGEEQDFTV